MLQRAGIGWLLLYDTEIWVPDEQANEPDLYATGLASTELCELQSRRKLSQDAVRLTGLPLLPWELRGVLQSFPGQGTGMALLNTGDPLS